MQHDNGNEEDDTANTMVIFSRAPFLLEANVWWEVLLNVSPIPGGAALDVIYSSHPKLNFAIREI